MSQIFDEQDTDELPLTAGKGSTVPGTSINADQQTQNQNTGTADHLDLGFRKQT
jgi:hypothetical protein